MGGPSRHRHSGLAALVLIALGLSGGTVFACDSLTVVPLASRLEFGNLRMPEGASGWLAVDPQGAVATSGAVNLSSGRRPSPAEIELQGSPGQRYLLELTHDSGANAERAAAVLGRLSVAVDGQPVAERGTTFQLTLPRPAQGARAVVRLSIGGDLQIRRFTSPMVVHAGIRLRCLASGIP